MSGRPQRDEAAEYYFKYIDMVGDSGIIDTLVSQSAETLAVLREVNEVKSQYRYADGKWSARELLSHVNDTERLFVSRAFWFARGFDTPLPSFDQEVAVAMSGAHDRAWSSHVEEFEAVRAATITFFRSLGQEAWDRRGVASDRPFSVRALAYIAAGHVTHHVGILRERYLAGS
jgi:hypothetical protein